MLLASAAVAGYAQYQLTNSDFEEWEEVSYSSNSGYEPVNWSSFLDGTGTSTCMKYAAYCQLYQETSELRPGTTGKSSAKLTSRAVKVLGVTLAVAQGNLTNGCVNMGSTSATDANGNYNYINESRSDQSMKFTGHPDAAHVWVKFSGSKKGNVELLLTTKGYYQSPDGNTQTATLVAKAQNNTISSDANNWQELTIPFTYSSTADPYYSLVNISTSATPGEGSESDYMYVDDLEMLYYSELDLDKSTYDGQAITFTDGNATIKADYDESKLNLVSNGHAATITKEYSTKSGLLRITVKGENYEEDNNNYHVYKIQFGNPVCSKVDITEACYATFCAPYDCEIPDGNGNKAYTVEEISSNGKLVLNELTNGIIPAATPVIMYNKNYSRLVYNCLPTVTGDQCQYGLLVGNYSPAYAPVGSYVLQNQDGKVGFYKVTDQEFSLSANRCYLTTSSSAKALYFGGDETDGIDNIEADSNKSDVIYDLSGRRVANAKKGVYIINGKKVMK